MGDVICLADSLISFFEAIILAGILSLDAFTAGFAYGSNKIKVPFCSVQIINMICSFSLGIALLLGNIIRKLHTSMGYNIDFFYYSIYYRNGETIG